MLADCIIYVYIERRQVCFNKFLAKKNNFHLICLILVTKESVKSYFIYNVTGVCDLLEVIKFLSCAAVWIHFPFRWTR